MGKIRRIKHEIAGILAITLSLIVFTSLITHHQWDPSFFTRNASKTAGVKNLLGVFGSYLSDTLLQILGITAYIIPLIFCIYGIREILGKEKRHRLIINMGATIILMLSMSSLFTLMFQGAMGGMIGVLVTGVSLRLISTVGSYLLFIPLTFVTLMFLIPFSIFDFLRGAKKVSTVSIPFKEKVKEQPQIRLKEPPVESPTYKQEPLPLSYPAEPKQRPTSLTKAKGDYALPDIEFLKDPPPSKSRPTKEDLLLSSSLLEKKLQDFSIEGKITQVSPGPIVTLFEFEPAPGVKINRVISLADDLALTLKATSLRISQLPGMGTLGIEVPNKEREDVFLKEIFSSDTFRKGSSKLSLALGKDIFGNPVVVDLGKMPHLLIAGATGSGKSVGLNSMVLSLLYRATPKEVKLIMIDPKMLELPVYEGIPHLILPIITSPKDASDALRKIVLEMEHRYRLLAETGSRNIETYNKKILSAHEGEAEPIPYIVIFIDELADLMLVSAHEVENSIARLAQMARAAGIHLILATQRPSVDVITGVIKANFSSRISFRVASKIDSRIILDTYGAEQLLSKGDMLFVSPGWRTTRIHGAYVSEEEVKTVVDFIKTQGAPDYAAFDELIPEGTEESTLEERDELYHQAKDLVLSTGQASISYVQRRLKIGYNRAARIIEMMEGEGIIGPPGEAGKPREILRKKR